MRRIAAIVEGHAEADAVPLLLRRIAEVAAPGAIVEVPRPIRVKRQRVLKEGELERTVDFAATPGRHRRWHPDSARRRS